MNDVTWVLLFFFAGLVAIVLEIILPGVIIGIMGLLAVCGSIVYAFATGHPMLGSILIGAMIVLLPVFFWVWKTVLRKAFAVPDNEKDFRPTTLSYDGLVGQEGEAVSALRPSGTMVLDGKRYSVVTRGEMIEKGTRVKVIEVTGPRIVVKRA